MERAELKKWLRDLREQAGYSQQTLAAELGVDRRTVFNVESPKTGLRSEYLLRWLELTGALPDHQSTPRPLRELRDQVAQGFEAVEAGIEQLDARLRDLGDQSESG